MADLNYLQLIGEAFEDAGEAINAALEAAEQPVLVDWYKGQPAKLRQENTPYAWYDLPIVERADSDPDFEDLVQFEVPINVGVVISGNNPGELLDLVFGVVPVVQAAIEGLDCTYRIFSAGLAPGPRVGQGAVCRAMDLPFLVRGQRPWQEAA